MKPKACKNCGAANPIRYCAECGQKVLTDRLTTRMILQDVWSTITNLETGFWYTTKMLFIAPAQVVRDVINRKTKPYYHPFRYVFIWSAVSVLLTLSFGVFDMQQESIQEAIRGTDSQSERSQQFQAYVNDLIKKYLQFVLLFLIPFGALTTRWLFKKWAYNYAEHLVINCYMYAQVVLIGTPFIIAYLAFPSLAKYGMFLSIIISVIYYTYLYRDLFKLSTGKALWKAFLTWVGSYTLFILTGMVVGTVLVIGWVLLQRAF